MIVWFARNRIDFFVVLLAARAMGVIVLPLNWNETAAVHDDIFQLTAPKLILVEPYFEGNAQRLADRFGCHVFSLNDALPQGNVSIGFNFNTNNDNDVWFLLFTSGTTRAPKAVMYSWRMAMANTENLLSRVSMNEDDNTLVCLPLYHTAGVNLFALPVLLNGGTLFVTSDTRPDTVLNSLLENRISLFLLVPTLFERIAQTAEFQDLGDISDCFRLVASGGAPLAKHTFDAWYEKGVVIQNGCGLTESGPILFLQTQQEALQQPCAVGNPVLGTKVELRGIDGSQVSVGERGEVWIKGDAVTQGYWSNAAANHASFKDGWFRTGDIAVQHQGQYKIIDRLNEMYICGGENVYPSEVETVLLAYPGVSEAIVTAQPHPVWGEVGVAFVILAPQQPPMESELLAYCRQQLARYKVPKRIEFVDQLPKTATGKIRRSVIQAWVKKTLT